MGRWKSGVVKHFLDHTKEDEVVLNKFILRRYGLEREFLNGCHGRPSLAKRYNGPIFLQIVKELRTLMDHPPEEWVVVDVDMEAPMVRCFRRSYLERLVRDCDA